MNARTRYVIISMIVLFAYGALAFTVLRKVALAEQLAFATKAGVWLLMAGFVAYGAYVFRKHLPKS